MKYMCEKKRVLLNKLYVKDVNWKYILISQSDSDVWFLCTYFIINVTIFSLKQLQDLAGDFPSQELLQISNYGIKNYWINCIKQKK